MKKHMKQQILFILILLNCTVAYSQTFEGWITYRKDFLNPNPKMFADSLWKKTIKKKYGERGYILQKNFYKRGKYSSEIDAVTENGFQVFNQNDKLLYAWKANSDTVVTINTKKSMYDLIEISSNTALDTILNIPCKSIIVKKALGQTIIWYNNEILKVDAKLYKGHKYGHWEQILAKIGCLPLKIEENGYIIQTAIEYKEEQVDENKFVIPKFKTKIENPFN